MLPRRRKVPRCDGPCGSTPDWMRDFANQIGSVEWATDGNKVILGPDEELEDELECDDEKENSIKTSYEQEFCFSQEKREELFQVEKDRMRNASEGKASLERYRIASARIFESIQEVR